MKLLRRLLFWEFSRGSWPYDLIVAAILGFIFLTPREFFNDQPKAASIVMLPANRGFLLEPALLDAVPEAQRVSAATSLVQKRFKTPAVIDHVEAVRDEETVTGYMAFTTP
jgi:hypothetical protein